MREIENVCTFLRLGDYIGIIFKEISMSWDNIVDSKEFFMVRF